MKTTQVPTEWLEELKRLNKLADEGLENNGLGYFDTAICVAKLIGHAKSLQYFQPQPEQPSNEVDLEEFAKWWFDSKYRFIEGSFVDGIAKKDVTFSEVLEAFKKSKG